MGASRGGRKIYVGFHWSGAHASSPRPGATDARDVMHGDQDPPLSRTTRRSTITELRTSLPRRYLRLLVVSITRAADAGRATERATLPP